MKNQSPTNVTACAPASVANLGSGFDCIGLAIKGLSDRVIVSPLKNPGIVVEVAGGRDIPLEANRNTAGLAAMALFKMTKCKRGVRIKIEKGIPPGSGLGSSAASAVAAVFGINRLFKLGLSREELIVPAMHGEIASAGIAHADNVAPSLLGNIVVGSASLERFRIIRAPSTLYSIIALPSLRLDTRISRAVLPENIRLEDAARQWARVAFLIEGFFSDNDESLAVGLGDEIAEPARKKLIPNFDLIKKRAIESGAIGMTISGGGPAMFGLARGRATALKIVRDLKKALSGKAPGYQIFATTIDKEGVRFA